MKLCWRSSTSLGLVLALVVFQAPSPAISATSTPTRSLTNSRSGVNDYPSTRFQAGRPSAVNGLRVLSSNVSTNTMTLTWVSNDRSEHVDQYAIYYEGDSPAPNGDYVGVPAETTSKNFASVSIVGFKANATPVNPYGQGQIPVCFSPFCAGKRGSQINVWVIAHNHFGWSDNLWFAPNPDENPAYFIPLSVNQRAALKAPKFLNLDLKKIDRKWVSATLPTYRGPADYSNLEDQTGTSASEAKLLGRKWTVPWLPDVHWPISRFGPNRPSDVKDVRVTAIDFKFKQMSMRWTPNPASENVDSYAVYLTDVSCSEDQTCQWLVGTVKTNLMNRQLAFGTLPIGDIYGKVSNGEILTLDPGRSYFFWVIAHNRNGWGDNDPDSPNPDQQSGDFRSLNASEVKSLSNNARPTNSTGIISIPCSVLPVSNQASC